MTGSSRPPRPSPPYVAPAAQSVAEESPSPDRRPVWLLDVDGVVNGTGRVGWGSAPRTARVTADGIPYQLRWAPQLITSICALLAVVDVRWATSWIDVGTEDLETAFGLPALPHAYPADASRLNQGRHLTQLHRAAKTRTALDVVATGRRLIWTDDEAIPTDGPERHLLAAAGALLISPDPRRGLREEHLRWIRDFLADDGARGTHS